MLEVAYAMKNQHLWEPLSQKHGTAYLSLHALVKRSMKEFREQGPADHIIMVRYDC